MICYSYDIPQKDGEWVLCCRAQDQSTSGHNIANSILKKKKLGETNEPIAVATQPRAPHHPKYKVGIFFLIYTSKGF
jgi:hypothetical protein